MKKVGRLVWSIIEVIIIIYVITITAFILCRNKYGYTQFGDYTLDSVSLMDERNISTAKKGDLLIIRNSNDFKVGDVIYYYAAYNESYVVRSDAILKVEDDGFTSLYTVKRGEDEVTVADNKIIGKYATNYKGLGAILDVVESRVGFLFLVLLPMMCIFIYHVYSFIIILKFEKAEPEEEIEVLEEEEKPKKKRKKKKK